MSTPTRTQRDPYVPPQTITAVPPTFTLDRSIAGDQLVIVLDTEAGRLWAEQWGSRTIHDQGPAYLSTRDLYFPGAGHEWWNRSARLIGWTPNHWPEFPAAQDTFTAVLELMAGWARELVTSLTPLPDGGWDWSLKATAAYERIGYLASYGNRTLTPGIDPGDPWHGDGTAPLPERHHYGAVSFAEVLAAAPAGWADPVWATLSDHELDLVAAALHGKYGSEVPEQFRKRVPWDTEDKLRATIRFHRQRHDGDPLSKENQNLPIYIVGARAGLRRYRAEFAERAAGLPAQHAATFLALHPDAAPAALRAASSDRELERIAEVLAAEAAEQHQVALVATAGELTARRAELRALARAELLATGDAYAHLSLELRQLGDRRAALLLEVASFQEEPEWDAEKGEPRYAELARAARMTRQAVRERLTTDGPPAAPDDAELADDVRDRVLARLTALGDAGACYVELDRVAGRILRVPLRPFLEDMAAGGTITRVGGTDGNPRYVRTSVRDADIATTVREHLNAHARNCSAVQLYEATVKALGDFPRSQLDAVLDRMTTAGDLGKNGTVGAMYYNVRR